MPRGRPAAMFGYVEMNNFTTFMSEYEKDIQDSESRRRHSEEIDRYQVFDMVVQETPPCLR